MLYLLYSATLAALPFQMFRPLWSWRGVSLHLPALLALFTVAASFLPTESAPRRPAFPAGRFPFLLLFLAVSAVSAALSEAPAGLAWKSLAESALGVLFAGAAFRAADTPGRRIAAMRLLAALALVEAGAGLWETFGGDAARRALSFFKEEPTIVDESVRASGTFLYATVYSMFLEAVFPFAAAWAGPAGAAAAGLGVFFSSTRTGWVTVALLSLAFLAGSRRRRWSLAAGVAAAAAAALLFPSRLWPRIHEIAGDLTVHLVPVSYEALHDLSRLRRGESGRMRLRLDNGALETWPKGTALAYAWSRPGDADPWKGAVRLPLETPVPPGASIVVEGSIRVPSEPGVYELRFDLETPSGQRWAKKGAFQPTHLVTVPSKGPWKWQSALPTEGVLPVDAPPRETRPMLWAAAARMFLAHPLLGAGPGAFNALAGKYSGGTIRDRRLQGHNIVLDRLAETGLAGCSFWLAGVLSVGAGLFKRARAGDHAALLILLSLSAWGIHGLLDDFLWHAPMGLLFYGTLGLGAAAAETA